VTEPALQRSQAKEEQPPNIPAGQTLPLWCKNDLIWNGGEGAVVTQMLGTQYTFAW